MRPLMFLIPVVYTLFVWWFSTGLIIAAYGRKPLILRLAFGMATAVMLAGVVGVWLTRDSNTLLSVYVAFTCGLLIWGWQTAGYYFGLVTGPTRPRHLSQMMTEMRHRSLKERFKIALYMSLYHELLVLLVGGLLAVMVWNRPNQWGFWIYIALWVMHSSAKLNVFFGVRNFRVEMLPQEFRYLDSLLTRRTFNPMFPFSVLIASSVTLSLLYRAIIPITGLTESVGLILVSTMIGLGVIEHWLMVLPLPATLFGWGLYPIPAEPDAPRPKATAAPTESVMKG